MATLIKARNKFYSKISVRVGNRLLNKRKYVYVKLLTDKYSDAKKRNVKVNNREQKIRLEIRKGYATKSDLLNINDNTDWSWVKADGSDTAERLITLSNYVDNFLKYKKIKQMRDSTIESYGYALAKFVKSVGSHYLVSDINQENIDDFAEYLHELKVGKDKKLSLSSIDSNLKAVSVFLNWCKVRGYIESVPIIELNRPTLDDKWLTKKNTI